MTTADDQSRKFGDAEMHDGFASMGADEYAYVRSVWSDDLIEELPEAADLSPGIPMFVLHAANGDPIMVTDDRQTAIEAALEHDLAPLSVH